ncbi:unnamed protein product [Adineta ricciae]|uniref:Uncharacterized protein n=1 Tax=Adineta ricciae TaxID=249248 RepID=A0A815QQK5_ADIRI|nr:unnamed protein product [Adineta ricciae]
MSRKESRSDRPFKILLIGDSAVGKTSLMFRFADNKFTQTFTPTIGIDFKLKTIYVRDKPVNLQLWDTAGQEKFFSIVRAYYRNADAVILVYDRTNASSFQSVARWMKTIEENAPGDVFRVLVANKCDLHDCLVVSNEHGRRLANQYHVDYFETSVKSDSQEKISRLFYYIAEKVVERRQLTPLLPPDPEPKKLNDPSHTIYDKLTYCC